MINYDKFHKALNHLCLQFENYQTLDNNLPELLQSAVAESVIQRFEICYDCLWKVLKRYLKEELGIPDVPNSPKPIFRLANENSLFVSSIEQWLRYSEARIATSHDYSGDKAYDSLKLMQDFINDADALYKTMQIELQNKA
ncbi:MAG: nucleotidyltransferase substrate binding protein [Magnetococcales bacterium]|nr:nucleotidyltransferase substrate binding protein [Magnetococcales bacterium]